MTHLLNTRKRPGTKPWLWLGLGAAFLVVVVVLIGLAARKEDAPTKSPEVPIQVVQEPTTTKPGPAVSVPAPRRPSLPPGTDPNALDARGESLLHKAARTGTPDDINMLIDAGADVDLPARAYGDTPLLVAVREKKIDNVRALLDRGADVEKMTTGNAPRSPLMHASQVAPLEIVKLLLDRGAKPNPVRDKGPRGGPLLYAASMGRLDVVKLLVARGADVNGSGALYAAARGGYLAVAAFLIEKGEDANAPSLFGDAPIVGATDGHHLAMVKFLIEKGADVNVARSDEYARSLLHHLVYHPDLNIAAIALEHGADPNLKDHDGKTVIELAIDRNKVAYIEFLLEKKPSLVGPSLLAAVGRCKDPKLVELLLSKGVPVDARDAQGRTALHLAAQHGRTKVIATLLGKGADVEARTTRGDTPLMLAAGGHEADAVRQLIDAGAKVNAVREKKPPAGRGWTALHSAARTGALKAAEVLIAKGADGRAKTTDGQTPADLAKIAVDELGFQERWDLLERLEALNPPKPKPRRIVTKVEEGKVIFLEGKAEDRVGRKFRVVKREVVDGAVVTTEEEIVAGDDGGNGE